MGALAPEAGDGFADREVGPVGVGVDVAGVGEFGGRGRVDEVDFGVGEGFQGLRVSPVALCGQLLSLSLFSIHPCLMKKKKKQQNRGNQRTGISSFSANVYTFACFSS